MQPDYLPIMMEVLLPHFLIFKTLMMVDVCAQLGVWVVLYCALTNQVIRSPAKPGDALTLHL